MPKNPLLYYYLYVVTVFIGPWLIALSYGVRFQLFLFKLYYENIIPADWLISRKHHEEMKVLLEDYPKGKYLLKETRQWMVITLSCWII